MISIIKTKDEVSASIQNIIKAISPNGRMRILTDVGQEFRRMTRLNFGSAGRYRGKQWAPLSKEYAKKVGSSTATDIRSGALYRSIQVGSTRRDYVNVYSRSPYGASVAFGDKKRNIPPRCFWPFEILGTPMRQRLVLNADRDMYSFISKRFNYLSGGQLPYQTMVKRSSIQVGNPFNSSR